MIKSELIKKVREHAMDHYEDGWDVVVEAWSDDEIIEEIGKATTSKGAIKKMAKAVKDWNSIADDIRATAF